MNSTSALLSGTWESVSDQELGACERNCVPGAQTSSTTDGQEIDFRGAIPPQGKHDRSESDAGVDRERTNFVEAGDVFLAECRQINRREKRKAYLAAVRVSGELKIDGRSHDVIRVVGFVREQDGGFIGG